MPSFKGHHRHTRNSLTAEWQIKYVRNIFKHFKRYNNVCVVKPFNNFWFFLFRLSDDVKSNIFLQRQKSFQNSDSSTVTCFTKPASEVFHNLYFINYSKNGFGLNLKTLNLKKFTTFECFL